MSNINKEFDNPSINEQVSLERESMLHFWITFVLRVIFIATCILLVLWFCSITAARIFGGRSWKSEAIIETVGAMGTTA